MILFLLWIIILLTLGLLSPLLLVVPKKAQETRRQFFYRCLVYAGVFTLLYIGLLSIARMYDYALVRGLSYYLWVVSVWFFLSLLFHGVGYLFDWFQALLKRSTASAVGWIESCNMRRYYMPIFIVVWVGIVCYGIWNFHRPLTVREISVVSEKVSEPVRFVQVADTQYWSTSIEHLEKTFDTIASLDPDFIVFIGDIVDFDYYNAEDFEFLENLTVPLYFVTWNHEYYHDVVSIRSILSQYPMITILDDTTTYLEQYGIAISWVDYRHYRSWSFEETIQSLSPDDQWYSIFLNHVPEKVDYTIDLWYDLLLYGHTHWWQMIPFTYVVDWIYKYHVWKFTIDDTIVNITSWAWLAWPRMRLWTNNEVVLFEIVPTLSK